MNASTDLAYQDLDYGIKWNRVTLQISGAWTEPGLSRTRQFLSDLRVFLVLVASIVILIIPQTMSLVRVWGDLDLIVDNLSTNVPFMTAMLKLTVTRWNKKELTPIIGYIIEDWMTIKGDRERETMLRNARISRMITIGGYSVMFAMAMMKLVPAYFGDVVQIREDNVTTTIRQFPFQTSHLYDASKTPNYEITYLMQFVAACFAVISYTGVDNFLSMLVLHACAQLENLNFSMKNLIPERDKVEKGDNFGKRLAIVVERHLHLIRFVKIIENSFNLMLLVQLVAFSVIFCFQGFQLFGTLENGGGPPIVQMIFLVVFLISTMWHIFIYCFVGESLIAQCEGLHRALYECEWYNLKPREASALILLMARTKIPLQITAGKFFAMSLPTFADILRKSASYLSVLIAIKE